MAACLRSLTSILASLALSVVATTMVIVAALRLFRIGVLGSEEFAILVGLWLFFLGGANASRDGTQITVSIIDSIPQIRGRRRQMVEILATLVTIPVCAFFLYYGMEYGQFTIDANLLIQPFGWPRFLTALSLIFGIALMLVYQIMRFVLLLKKLRYLDK
jgi:TRAP-type C4-dicarboxylate transport system permease small subunit